MPAACARTPPRLSSTVTSANPSTTQSVDPPLRKMMGRSTLLPVAALDPPVSPRSCDAAQVGVPGGIGNGGAGVGLGGVGKTPLVGSGSQGTADVELADWGWTEPHDIRAKSPIATSARPAAPISSYNAQPLPTATPSTP